MCRKEGCIAGTPECQGILVARGDCDANCHCSAILFPPENPSPAEQPPPPQGNLPPAEAQPPPAENTPPAEGQVPPAGSRHTLGPAPSPAAREQPPQENPPPAEEQQPPEQPPVVEPVPPTTTSKHTLAPAPTTPGNKAARDTKADPGARRTPRGNAGAHPDPQAQLDEGRGTRRNQERRRAERRY